MSRTKRALSAGVLAAVAIAATGCSASLDARIGGKHDGVGFSVGGSVGATVDGQDTQPYDTGGRTYRNLYPFERGRQ